MNIFDFAKTPRKKRVLHTGGKLKTSEVGLQTVNWDALGGEGYNPDEIGIATYKNMMKDAEVRAAYNLIKFSTLSRDWKIIVAEQSKQNEKIVKSLMYTFEHMDGRLEGGMSNLLLALPYGFSVIEKVYKLIEEGEFKGQIGIKKMKGLDPETIEFKTDKYGNLESVTQEAEGLGEKKIKLPLERLIIYTNEKEFGNYYGTPRLRAIYKNWFIKDVITKFWNISLERFGMPMLIGKVPSSKDLKVMTDVLTNAQSRSSIATVDGWEIDALETGIGRSSGGDYKSALAYHDAQIAKGMLIPSTINDPQGGSFAKAKVGFDVFVLTLRSLELDLTSIVEKYLIKPLVDYNYGIQDSYPQFVFEPLTHAEFLELAKVFAILVKSGVIGSDETWMRDKMRVPKRSELVGSGGSSTVGGKGSLEKVPLPEMPKTTQQVKTPKPSRSSSTRVR